MRRLLVVVVLSAVGFALAVNVLQANTRRDCVGNAPVAPPYGVRITPPARVDITTYSISVSEQGRPVTGARVCLVAAFGDGTSVKDEADEISPGTYEVSIEFELQGPWNASVLVEEPGKPGINVPTSFDVQPIVLSAPECDCPTEQSGR